MKSGGHSQTLHTPAYSPPSRSTMDRKESPVRRKLRVSVRGAGCFMSSIFVSKSKSHEEEGCGLAMRNRNWGDSALSNQRLKSVSNLCSSCRYPNLFLLIARGCRLGGRAVVFNSVGSPLHSHVSRICFPRGRRCL